MNFTPKKEEELSKFKLLPEGEYPFTVIGSDEVASKSAKNAGKMMFALTMNVHGEEFDVQVKDWFADWFSEWKLKHFCDSTGLSGAYESGKVDGRDNAFEGRQGYVKLGIENTVKYGDKNVVEDYVVITKDKPETVVYPGQEAQGGGATPKNNTDDVPF